MSLYDQLGEVVLIAREHVDHLDVLIAGRHRQVSVVLAPAECLDRVRVTRRVMAAVAVVRPGPARTA